MKRITVLTVVLLITLLCFTVCVKMEDHIIINEDGSGTVSSRIEIEKDAADQIAEELQIPIEDILKTADDSREVVYAELIDGTEFYIAEETMEFENSDILKAALEKMGNQDVVVSEQGIYYLLNSGLSEEELREIEAAGMNLDDSIRVKILITMPEQIEMSTGAISEDGLTAEFLFKGRDLCENQDIVVSSEEETKKPVFRGVKSKKTYNSARTVSASDESGIQKLEYQRKKTADSKYGKYKAFEGEKTFTQNGIYRVRATDYYGNRTTRTFTISDSKRPEVKLDGKMNKKQTYYKGSCLVKITDNCKVKSVKYYIDGKRVKVSLAEVLANGLSAGKAGTHKIVASDINGNTAEVTFKVK